MIIGISGKKGCGKSTVGRIIQYLTQYENVGYLDFKNFDECYQDNSINKYATWRIKMFAGKLKEICSLLTGIPVEDFEKEEVKNQKLPDCWKRYHVILEGKTIKTTASWIKAQEQRALYILSQPDEIVPVTIVEFQPTVRWLLQHVGTNAMRDVIHENIWLNALFADYKKSETTWIITDVRFPNELLSIKDRGGITIRINRPKDRQIGATGFIAEQAAANSALDMHPSETALDNARFDHVIDNDGTTEDLVKKIRTVLNMDGIPTNSNVLDF